METNLGNIKDFFTRQNILSNSDINAIRAYNAQINSCVGSQTAFNRTMLNASETAQTLVSQANGNIVAFSNLTKSSKAAALGMQALSTAGNMLVMLAISKGIELALKGIDNLAHSAEHCKERVDELMSSYQSTLNTANSNAQTAEGLASKYETLSKGVNNLGQNVSLTTDEYSEYNNIVNQIADMFPSLVSGYTEEGNAILSLKGNVAQLRDAYKEAQQEAYNMLIVSGEDSDGNDIIKNWNNLDKTSFDFGDVDVGKGISYNDAIKTLNIVKQMSYEDYWDARVATTQSYYDQLSEEQKYVHDHLTFLDDNLNSDIHDRNGYAQYQKEAKILVQTYNAEVESRLSNVETLANAYLMTNTDYAELDEESKNAVSVIINNLNAEIASAFHSKEDVGRYVDDIVQIISSNPKAQNAIIGLLTMNTTDMPVNRIQTTLDSNIKTIATVLNEDLDALKIRLGFDNLDTQNLINKVQGLLKDEFDGNVGELTLEDLKIAAEQVEVPENALLSWDELKQKIEAAKKDTNKNTPKQSFQDAWQSLQDTDDDELKNTRQDLLTLAEAGQLTEEAFHKTTGADLFLSQISESAEETIQWINQLVSSADQLTAMKTGIKSISDVLAQKQENLNKKETKKVGIGADTLGGFDASIKGLDSWEEFEKKLGNGESSMEKCRKAANRLATEWVNSNNFLSQLDETKKDYYISTLKEMGVLNAEEVVTESLAKKDREAALEKKYAQVETAFLAKSSTDETATLKDEIDILAEENDWSKETTTALYQMALQKQTANGIKLDTTEDIEQLQALVSALGGSTKALEDWKNKRGKGSATDDQQLQDKAEESVEDVKEGMIVLNTVLPKIKVNPNSSLSDKDNGKEKEGDAVNSNYSSPTAQKSAKTFLQKFQDWVGKLFDWIDIKIQKQTDKVDKYASRAETAKDTGRYAASARNYRNAANATATQIAWEQKASKQYNSQANKVVSQAVSMGVVSQKQASIIKKQVQNGSMAIASYGKKVQEVIKDYQEWYQKSKEASKAITELHNNIRTYIQDLKDMRDAQRDAKLDKIDTYSSIGTEGYAYTSSAQNSQLTYSNSQLNKQNKAYSTEVSAVNRDVTKIGNTGKKAVKKALNSKEAKGNSKKAQAYQKALKNAQTAIKAKRAVSSADLKTIQSHSAAIYNKLYAYNLSLDNLEAAKLEQAVNYAATTAERQENISQKYTNKNDEANNEISLSRQKSENATSAAEKNSELNNAAAQYDNIVSNDQAAIAKFKQKQDNNADKIHDKAWKGKNFNNLGKKKQNNVTSYIQKAKDAAKQGKSIDAGVISKLAQFCSKGYVSQSFYNSCVNYNEALEHTKEWETQLEIDEQTAIQEKAAIGTEKFNNVEQEYTNQQNIIQSNKNQESINQSIKSAKGFDLSATDYQAMINYSKQQEQSYSNEIEALNKTIQENKASGLWNEASQEYIDAQNSVNRYQEQLLECQKEQIELNNTMAQLPLTAFERAITFIQSVKSNLQSLLSIKSAKGIAKTGKDILGEIAYNDDEITEEKERRQYLYDQWKKAEAQGGAADGKTADEWKTEYYDSDTRINNLDAENIEKQNEIIQLPFDEIQQELSLLDSIASRNKSAANLKKALGNDLSAKDYQNQMEDNKKQIKQYEKESLLAYNNYLKALADEEGVYGGKTADQWLEEYNGFGATIDEIKTDTEDIRKAMRDDVYWRTFERAHDTAQRLKDVLSGISDLISDDMLYDKDGNLTEFGAAQMANIIKQYETARTEVENYTNDIRNLDALYAEGQYTEEAYKEKLNELQSGLLDSASSMKTFISEIINMNKQMAQSELDALFDVIDARNEALSAKKAYYDYDKTIRDKTKDIQALQAQIGALEGVETAEAKAQKARLEAELADAKDDLNDTIMNHSFELSKDALEQLKTTLQDEFDDKWDNVSQDLGEVQKLIGAANKLTSSQSHIISGAFNKLFSLLGIDTFDTNLNYFGDAVTLSQGDAAALNDLPDNSLHLEPYYPLEFTNSQIPDITDISTAPVQQNSVNVQLGSMVNIEGNVVEEELPRLNNLLDMAYQYTIEEITKDARKIGIKA